MSLPTLFDSPAALPVLPQAVQQLIQSLAREDVSLAEIAQHITTDPVLSAKTLRLANSAYFRASRQIGTIEQALHMLGLAMVRNLIMGLGVSSAFPKVPGLDLPQFWRFSLYSAGGARWLAQAAGEDGDLAFTIGLMQGLGHLVMHAVPAPSLDTLNRHCHPLAAARCLAEQQALGYHHGQVSVELAQRWKFPVTWVETLREVHELSADTTALAPIIRLAVWRARAEVLNAPTDALSPPPHNASVSGALQPTWVASTKTLNITRSGKPQAMPMPTELCEGLEAMLCD